MGLLLASLGCVWCVFSLQTFDQQILRFFKCFQEESNELILSFYFSRLFFTYYNVPIGLSHCKTTFKLDRDFFLFLFSSAHYSFGFDSRNFYSKRENLIFTQQSCDFYAMKTKIVTVIYVMKF